jgi:predicted dehydrogenase
VLEGLGHQVAVATARTDLDRVAYTRVADAVNTFRPDYAVVSTATARHAPSVVALEDAGFTGRLLIEKPLAVPLVSLASFARVGVGFNLRFHPAVRRLHEVLAGTRIHTVEAYVGQHLSLWRPGREPKTVYSARLADGGGVLRDLSHEWDYLALILGACRGVFARGGRVADVTEDSDDAWGVVAEYERAPVVTVQLNYLDTQVHRRVLATTDAGTVEADLIAGTVRVDDVLEHFAVERDDTYRAMHAAMLAEDPAPTFPAVATVDEATRTDALIRMIETSARTRTWVEAA